MSAQDIDLDLEQRSLVLSARAKELEARLGRSINVSHLARLRRERDDLIKQINGVPQLAPVETAHPSTIYALNAQEAAPKKKSVFEGLEALVENFGKSRLRHVKILHARAANEGKLKGKIANRIKKRAEIQGHYNEGTVIIHVIPNVSISKLHGDMVAMYPDGTVLKKVGAYAKYGKAQYVTLKVDIEGIKGYLQNGAVASPATTQLIKQVCANSIPKLGSPLTSDAPI